MGGAYYIMMVNVAVGVVLLVGFTALWVYDRNRPAPLFMALATLFFLGSGGLELSAPFFALQYGSLYLFVLYSVNLAAGVLLGAGVTIHYRLDPHWKLTGVAYLLGLLVTYLVLDMPRQSVLRMSINQLPLVLAIGTCAARVIMVKQKSILDQAVAAALVVFAINLAGRPAVLWFFGTMGNTAAEAHATDYAIVSNLALAIVTMSTATILMLTLVADLVSDLTRKSQRDPLTGLLNRRGLNARLSHNGISAEHGMQPVSVVIADIDHFKAVNDIHGHAIGDKVIQRFARLLEAAAGGQHLVSRIGGEEFAIVLPACDVAMARMFAEGVRTVFAETAISELPSHPVSASFGVAGWRRGAPLDQAISAADTALYRAKRAGRNRVQVAGNSQQALRDKQSIKTGNGS